MLHNKIRTEVDIYKFPTVVAQPNENSEVTIGDLHGNAMKFMFMLVERGIASNISNEDYNQLVAIYKKPANQITAEDIAKFNRIVGQIKFNKTPIRLIGDELADRGSNDYFTLKILQRLHQQHVPVEIIISNHGVEFLQACEKHATNHHFHAPMLSGEHAASLENLHQFVEEKLVTPDEVLAITEQVYKPCLRAISYSLNDDQSEITLYSHAAIGLNTIKDFANEFKVLYQDSTATELAKTIDAINSKFQDHVKQSTVNTLCPSDAMFSGYQGYADLTKTPLVCVMWNRRYDLVQRPDKQNGYNLIYVHGHDPMDPKQNEQHVCNLDENNKLGKLGHINQGSYVILVTHKKNCVLAEEKQIDAKNSQQQPLKTDSAANTSSWESLFQQLQQIEDKEKTLRAKGHIAAANAAKTLCQTIRDQTVAVSQDINAFKTTCKAVIDQARPELEKHRGWGLILKYLAATITGIGFFVALADIAYSSFTKKHFSLFKTDTAKRVKALKEALYEEIERKTLNGCR